MAGDNLDGPLLRHLAGLARLSLRQEEESQLRQDLEAIVGYVKTLSEVESSIALPKGPPANPTLRTDEIREGLTREEALAAAPEATAEGFSVPLFVDES